MTSPTTFMTIRSSQMLALSRGPMSDGGVLQLRLSWRSDESDLFGAPLLTRNNIARANKSIFVHGPYVRGAWYLKIIVANFKPLIHPKYQRNWCHMKGLNMIFQMRYSSPVCYGKWLCDSPKCGAHLHEPGTPQKYA